MYTFVFKVQYFNFPRFYIFVSCSLPNSWHFSLNQRVNYSSHFPNRLISSCENVEAIIVQYCWHFGELQVVHKQTEVAILISGHGLGCVQTKRSSVLLTPLSMYWLLMKNTLEKDHQMTDTLTPFQIFFSLSVMNKIYPLSFFRRLCNITAGGNKEDVF